MRVIFNLPCNIVDVSINDGVLQSTVIKPDNLEYRRDLVKYYREMYFEMYPNKVGVVSERVFDDGVFLACNNPYVKNSVDKYLKVWYDSKCGFFNTDFTEVSGVDICVPGVGVEVALAASIRDIEGRPAFSLRGEAVRLLN